MRIPLTLLKCCVIHRVREAGYHSLADCCAEAWPAGEQCQLPPIISEREMGLRANWGKAEVQAGVTIIKTL